VCRRETVGRDYVRGFRSRAGWVPNWVPCAVGNV
jgi:hypothetical protein